MNDAAASGGAAIEWPNNGSNQNFGSPSDSSTGQVQIQFTLSQTANVQFQMLANLAGADNDSFHYRLDSGSWVTQNNQGTSGYGTITPATFSNLAAGTHTLRIVRREDGARLDRITLTASAGLISSSGSSSSSSSSSSASSSSSTTSSTSSSSSSSSSGGFDSSNCNLNTPENWPCYFDATNTFYTSMCGCVPGMCGCSKRPSGSDPSLQWNTTQCQPTRTQYHPCTWQTETATGACSAAGCGSQSTSSTSSSTSSSSSSSSGMIFSHILEDTYCPSSTALDAAEQSGYNGNSYLAFTATGMRVDLPAATLSNATLPSTGVQSTHIRYANGATTTPVVSVYENNVYRDSYGGLFVPAGSWSTWQTASLPSWTQGPSKQISLVMEDALGSGIQQLYEHCQYQLDFFLKLIVLEFIEQQFIQFKLLKLKFLLGRRHQRNRLHGDALEHGRHILPG